MNLLPFKAGDKLLTLSTTKDHQGVVLSVNGSATVELTIEQIVTQCCFDKPTMLQMMDSPGTAWPTTLRVHNSEYIEDKGMVYFLGGGTFENPKDN